MTFNAKAEAMSCRRDDNRLNTADCLIEFAYSPEHNTVGCRWREPGVEPGIFRIFNVNYPLFGHNERVTDWVSVGVCLPLREFINADRNKVAAGSVCCNCRVAFQRGDKIVCRTHKTARMPAPGFYYSHKLCPGGGA